MIICTTCSVIPRPLGYKQDGANSDTPYGRNGSVPPLGSARELRLTGTLHHVLIFAVTSSIEPRGDSVEDGLLFHAARIAVLLPNSTRPPVVNRNEPSLGGFLAINHAELLVARQIDGDVFQLPRWHRSPLVS